ncbi:MAG: helix-hairpin-helix domain-containing protein [Deltaproteobacteria bacterium]|nr:helix-hairpin-helix domain-containing protein [Deltaproteobacteria bacterium]
MHQAWGRRWSGFVWVAALGVALGVSSRAPAREYEAPVHVDSLEDLYELQHQGDLEDDSVEVLGALLQRPMNVNRADRYLLYDLPQLTYAQADAIIAYRADNGPFEALEKLAEVPGLSSGLIAAIAPFITFGDGEPRPVESTTSIRGKAEVGSIWRQGLDKNRAETDPKATDYIDPIVERKPRYPQTYLRLQGTGFTYLGAGALATFRRRTIAWWDYSRGYLVSNGPSDRLDLDSVYVFGGYGAVSMVLGSYTVGFGERLVFSSASPRFPHGWYENHDITEDNELGRLRPTNGQFGAAVSLTGAEIGSGWLDATVFVSDNRNDLYQYHLNYGLDPWYGANHCNTDSDCPGGYTCGGDGTCRASRIYQAGDLRQKSYTWETVKDAYEERLGGANVTANFGAKTHVGATAYVSTTSVRVGTEANSVFAYTAVMPRERQFGAYGVNAGWGYGPVELSAEVARTLAGGNGAYVRSVLTPTPQVELELGARYYGVLYENPHGRGEAARDKLFGLAARNERGLRLKSTFRPISDLKLVTGVDLWQNPYLPAIFFGSGAPEYRLKQEIPVDLWVMQRFDYEVTSKESASLLLDYKNKDLAHNKRGEVYDAGDFCDIGELADHGFDGATCGRGERRKLQLRFTTKRVARTSLWASYTAAWEDVSKYKNRLDFEQRFRLHAAVDGWTDGRVVAHVSYYSHKVDRAALAAASAIRFDPDDERGDPLLETYLELHQKILGTWKVWVRYGVIHYKGDQLGRFQWYQLAKLNLEARF